MEAIASTHPELQSNFLQSTICKIGNHPQDCSTGITRQIHAKKNDEKAKEASDQWRIGIDAGHVVKDPQRRTSRHARGCPSSWPWSPPNQGCAPDYSIAQADAAGLGTECTKARSSRAAKGDSGKIHCNAGTRERCKLLCGDVAKQQLPPEGQESLARVARASGAGGRSGAGSRAER